MNIEKWTKDASVFPSRINPKEHSQWVYNLEYFCRFASPKINKVPHSIILKMPQNVNTVTIKRNCTVCKRWHHWLLPMSGGCTANSGWVTKAMCSGSSDRLCRRYFHAFCIITWVVLLQMLNRFVVLPFFQATDCWHTLHFGSLCSTLLWRYPNHHYTTNIK